MSTAWLNCKSNCGQIDEIKPSSGLGFFSSVLKSYTDFLIYATLYLFHAYSLCFCWNYDWLLRSERLLGVWDNFSRNAFLFCWGSLAPSFACLQGVAIKQELNQITEPGRVVKHGSSELPSTSTSLTLGPELLWSPQITVRTPYLSWLVSGCVFLRHSSHLSIFPNTSTSNSELES